jgi:ribosomal protein S27AE
MVGGAEAVEAVVCGNGECPYCGSCLVLDVSDGRLRCRRCGYVSEDVAFYEHIVGKPSTYSREESASRKQSISGRLRQITALRRDITWEGLGSNSKTNAERGAKDMANYTKRLAKALIGTGDFSEDEARALAEAFVRHYRALRYGDGLPKVGTVIEVLNSITSGKSNEEGGNYNMAIASALRRAFTTTGAYKPLIRRALREFTPDLEDGLAELATKVFRVIYSVIDRYTKGARRKYLPTAALLAAAIAIIIWSGLPLDERAVTTFFEVHGKGQVLKKVDVKNLVENVRRILQNS